MIKETQTLYFREGGSDKVYQASIVEVQNPAGYHVEFAYGRRGAALRTGSKTADPVPFDKAKKIYDALLQGKMSSGYTPGEDGKPYQSTEHENKVTGLVPQLLSAITHVDCQALLADTEHFMQEKWDGRRTLIQVKDQTVTGANKKGLQVAVTQEIEQDAKTLGDCVIDGEFMGDFLVVFDLLERNGENLRPRPYLERLKALDALLPDNTKTLRKIETAVSPEDKQALYTKLQAARREGVVFKRKDAQSHPGKPASRGSQLKYKFYAENSFLVSKVNKSRSVALQVFNDQGEKVNVGNVTIPPNMEIPQVGDILEVTYLYAYPGGSIYQPKNPRARTDAAPEDCQLSKLKFKADLDDENGEN